jgi:activator of HSP90 ATPase
MALPPSTANWHWKNKNVTRWGEDWFKRELTSISISGDSESERVYISAVDHIEGDIELGQRKSKCATHHLYSLTVIIDHAVTGPTG